jgi:hypothetical protein
MAMHRQVYPFRRFGVRRCSDGDAVSRLGSEEQNADCLEAAGGTRLWNRCDPAKQEELASEFAEGRCEALRDAILDLQDTPVPEFPAAAAEATAPATTAEIVLGRLLWTAWRRFRDRAMRELLIHGELFTGE